MRVVCQSLFLHLFSIRSQTDKIKIYFCLFQDFSGVGKRLSPVIFVNWRKIRAATARRHQRNRHSRMPSVVESLMELSVALSRQGLPEMENILFEEANPNLGFAVEKALQRPVLIILDEAQRFFRAKSGAPMPEIDRIRSFFSRNRQSLPGRRQSHLCQSPVPVPGRPHIKSESRMAGSPAQMAKKHGQSVAYSCCAPKFGPWIAFSLPA